MDDHHLWWLNVMSSEADKPGPWMIAHERKECHPAKFEVLLRIIIAEDGLHIGTNSRAALYAGDKVEEKKREAARVSRSCET